MAFDIINDVADGLHLHDLIILDGDAELVFQVHDHNHDVGAVCFEIVNQAGIAGEQNNALSASGPHGHHVPLVQPELLCYENIALLC